MAHRVSLPEDMKNILADFLMPAKIEIKSQMRRVLYDINQLRGKNPKKIREWTTCWYCEKRKKILFGSDAPGLCNECGPKFLADMEEERMREYANTLEFHMWQRAQAE